MRAIVVIALLFYNILYDLSSKWAITRVLNKLSTNEQFLNRKLLINRTVVYTKDTMGKRYTVDELATKLKVSKRTILREIAKGKLSAQKIGRKYTINSSSLLKYLNKGGNIDTLGEVKRYTNSKKSEMTTVLQQMVSIDSESGTASKELKLAKFIKSFLDRNRIRAVLYEDNGSIAVHASYGFKNKGVLLDGPLDTVHTGDLSKWKYPPFDGVIKSGRMYGRGTADCKAGIVAMIYSMLSLKKFVNEEDVRVEMVFDGGEQNGQYAGMKEVLLKGLPVEAGIVGYSGDMNEIVIGGRGYHRYIFTTHGKSVHTGSRYKSGVNAIDNMMKFTNALKKWKLPDSKHKLFNFGSRLTISEISGGRAINIVPDECVVKVDIRTVPEINKKNLDKLIQTTIKELHGHNEYFDIDWEYSTGHEAFVLDTNERIVHCVSEAVTHSLNKRLPFKASGAANIGNLLDDYDIPIVVFGPKGDNIHSYNEYVEIESIPLTAGVYSEAILRYFDLIT